jgi:hypothetical protein
MSLLRVCSKNHNVLVITKMKTKNNYLESFPVHFLVGWCQMKGEGVLREDQAVNEIGPVAGFVRVIDESGK